ncbi:UrcA family protein [Sphingomonas laterariae]|uniref:UrcA family protein n=1 Tax=Edaphosphingomonas laterariae TaxID=861865 RepID=A0A239CDU1_9SPHN|nr:UrcA family protein [Sphingomonas laterariae]SNS18119.1 UrcA family protein [Sphingomonas laterariae]
MTRHPFLIPASMACISIAAVGAASMAPALAEPPVTTIMAAPDGTRNVRISYRDLDLASADGQKALAARVRKAGRVACDADDAVSSFDPARRACVHDAYAGARPQMAAAIARARTSDLAMQTMAISFGIRSADRR